MGGARCVLIPSYVLYVAHDYQRARFSVPVRNLVFND